MPLFLAQCACSQEQADILPEPEIVSKQIMEARQVIRYEHASRTQWGYKSEQTDLVKELEILSRELDGNRLFLWAVADSVEQVDALLTTSNSDLNN